VVLMSSLHKREGRQWWGSSAPPPTLTAFARRLVAGLDEIYPYRMFPVGWYYFLDSLLVDNPFTDLVPQVEIFDEERASATVLSLLEPGADREKTAAAHERYLVDLRSLPEVTTIVRELAGG
jgi:hypothetical protein